MALNGTFMDWWAARSAGAGSAGSRFLNFVADAHCNPAATAVGSMIVSIWAGPAGGAAAGQAATEIGRAAGCDAWNQSLWLKQQLGREGTSVTRDEAYQLIKTGAYVRDENTGYFHKTTSFSGLWMWIRPFVPYLGIAIGIWLVIKAV